VVEVGFGSVVDPVTGSVVVDEAPESAPPSAVPSSPGQPRSASNSEQDKVRECKLRSIIGRA
jgi:hypothetical protein